MKIGLCEKDLRGSLAENMDWMAANGIAGFQLWKGKMDSENLKPQDILDMAGERGLVVTAVGGGPNLVDPACAEQSIDRFKGFLDLSIALNAPIVSAETKAKPEGISDEEAWASTTATVKSICAYAESVGSCLAIEAAGPCFVRDHEMFIDLKTRVGSSALKVNYDPANIVWAGKDPVDGVKAVGADIVHTHAKDIARMSDSALDTDEERLMDVPAGEGLVGYAEYLPALKASGFDGWLTIEMHAGKEGRPDDIIAAVKNLENILADL